MRFVACVNIHEGARSHCDFYITNIEAALSKHRRLLVCHLQEEEVSIVS